MYISKSLFLVLAALLAYIPHLKAREISDLSGEWQYILHDAPMEIPAEGSLNLPGTLDTNSIGVYVPVSDNTAQLSRKFTYAGNASYYKDIEIPQSWEGKAIQLFLERTRPATIYVDGVRAGSSSRISSPQRYDLSEFLTPGKHRIEIKVNNKDSIPLSTRNNSHACTESTQTNWNGIIGKMELRAMPELHIASATVFPTPHENNLTVKVTLSQAAKSGMSISVSGENSGEKNFKLTGGEKEYEFQIPLTAFSRDWSEWDPAVDNIMISLHSMMGDTTDSMMIKTGTREFKAKGTNMTVNGKLTFMRGRHDACVFPLTAHVPMDYETWREYFETIKKYGLNHVRFHSWCPPEECFNAADDAGIYLQPELPIWGEIDKDQKHLLEFLNEDMIGIMEEYSSHPSFTMFAIGNELWGDISLMKGFLDRGREINPDLMMTYGSNIYLGWKGHIEGEDFLVTCRVGDGEGFSTHTRASFSYADADNGGIMNSTYPNSSMNFSKAISHSPVPVIGHETGQYQIYPDFREVLKYSGVLRPDNLQEFAKRADVAGNTRKALKFFRASGEWATRLYRADMEMNLRTPGLGGFQLLDIQDYPGQGTALVGILDAFMDSKGLITPEEWRQSCSDITILAEFPKFCFTSGEQARIPVKVANYSGESLRNFDIQWETPFASGTLNARDGEGLVSGGEIFLPMPPVEIPCKSRLTLKNGSKGITNSYDIWIFPKNEPRNEEVVVTTDMDFALSALANGERVILCPDTATAGKTTLGPLFQTDYWNYRMFRSICDQIGKEPSPGTLGLLVDTTHPALNLFPTDFHTDWQWFAIVANSRPLIIDRLPKDVDPIVEVIDNVERNYRISLMLECNVGKGKLMIISADLQKMMEYPEGRWFLASAKEYMASKKCKPKLALYPEQVRNLLTRPSAKRIIKELRNESYSGKINL